MTGVQTCALPICFPVTIGGHLPDYLHRKLLVSGAARLVWEQIETDIEQPKVLTMFHMQNFEDGIVKFR